MPCHDSKSLILFCSVKSPGELFIELKMVSLEDKVDQCRVYRHQVSPQRPPEELAGQLTSNSLKQKQEKERVGGQTTQQSKATQQDSISDVFSGLWVATSNVSGDQSAVQLSYNGFSLTIVILSTDHSHHFCCDRAKQRAESWCRDC